MTIYFKSLRFKKETQVGTSAQRSTGIISETRVLWMLLFLVSDEFAASCGLKRLWFSLEFSVVSNKSSKESGELKPQVWVLIYLREMYCFFEINCVKTSGLRRKESSFFVIYCRITSSNSRVDNFNLCNHLTNNRQLNNHG